MLMKLSSAVFFFVRKKKRGARHFLAPRTAKRRIVDHTWRVPGPARHEFRTDDSTAVMLARAEAGTYLRNYIREAFALSDRLSLLVFLSPCGEIHPLGAWPIAGVCGMNFSRRDPRCNPEAIENAA